MSNEELLFGFLGADGIARRIAKLSVSTSADGQLRNLYVFQSDAAGDIHFSLHYSKAENESPVYHIRYEHPELISKEDQPSGPEIIDLNIPNAEDLRAPWPVQAVPFWVRDDLDSYGPMSKQERHQNEAGIADARDLPFGPQSTGTLETLLVRPGDTVSLERLRAKVARGLRCWRVHNSVTPWILAYIRLSTVRAGRIYKPPGI